MEQYSGLYVQVEPGKDILAPAPLKVTGYQPRDGAPGGVVSVDYGNGFTGYYVYVKLNKSVKVGDAIPRGKAFATTQLCDGDDPHIHFFLIRDSIEVDPYDFFTEVRIPHYAN